MEKSPAATEIHAERISGLIERVTFFNEESGFCVLRVKAPGHRDLVTVVGSSPSVSAGEWLTAEGTWVRDKEHGLQLKATVLRTVPPTTTEGIERYLGSGMVKGIGPIFAKRMVERFGAERGRGDRRGRILRLPKVHQAGYGNVVALMGASLSDRQSELLHTYFRELVVMLDGDEAGGGPLGRWPRVGHTRT